MYAAYPIASQQVYRNRVLACPNTGGVPLLGDTAVILEL